MIIDVNRKTWTVKVESRHSAKTVEDIQCLAPYHHYANGEGVHHLPEIGAICLLAWPSDSTPPFVLGYLGLPSVEITPDDQAARPQHTDNPAGSPTDVSFRSRRLDLNPGDVAITTRDENFIVARRGGIIQLGATPLSQRLYLPVLNYIKDFCENYEMQSLGGELSWRVARSESDPTGKAPVTWVLNLLEFAQDVKATVRIQHFPNQGPGDDSKAAWDVAISPQGIDLDDGSVSNATYAFRVTTTGEQTEMVAADRTIEVVGKDSLVVGGDHEVSVSGNSTTSVQGNVEITGTESTLGGSIVKLGSRAAAMPAVLGPPLVSLLGMPMIVTPVGGGPPIGQALLSPPQLGLLSQILSTKVFLE